ncbi:MAG: hypothetical protein ACOYJK_00865 [Prevotella sp.]|jgi:hypothetical protein
MMKKNYVTPELILLPMQIVGPNANISDDDTGGGMHPIDAKEMDFVDEADSPMSTGWDEWE